MATMIPCPACKKKISEEATACPKCGQPITEEARAEALKKVVQEKKAGRIGCGVILLVLVILGAIGSQQDKKAPPRPAAQTTAQAPTVSAPAPQEEPAPKVEKPAPVFNITVKQFVDNYNKAAKAADSSQRARALPSKGQSTQVEITKNNGVVISTSDSGKIVHFMYIGTGDGTTQSGAQIILGMAFAIGAIKPDWPTSKRRDVMRALGLLDGSMPEKSSAVVGGVKFDFMFSQGTGVFFSAAPAKE